MHTKKTASTNRKKRIYLLTTGGTIAGKYNVDSGLIEAGAYSANELSEHLGLDKITQPIDLSIKAIFQLDSSQMRVEDVCTLLREMERLYHEEEVDGFVITHGTDTLEETAYILDLLWKHDVPVVLTGSQRSLDDVATDAYDNMFGALVLASHEEMARYRVIVYFNEQIFDPRFVRKQHTSNINGFGVSSGGSLGLVDGEQVYFYSYPLIRETYPVPETLVSVAMLREHMDMCPCLYQVLGACDIAGLVVEGFGRGQVCPSSADEILKLLEQKMPILLTSTCDQGSVKGVYQFKGSISYLLQYGAINAHTYSPKKARIKLQILLSLRQDKKTKWGKMSDEDFAHFLQETFRD